MSFGFSISDFRTVGDLAWVGSLTKCFSTFSLIWLDSLSRLLQGRQGRPTGVSAAAWGDFNSIECLQNSPGRSQGSKFSLGPSWRESRADGQRDGKRDRRYLEEARKGREEI